MIKIVLIALFLVGCSTINPSIFEEYDKHFSSTLSNLEKATNDIYFFGEELFVLEVTTGVTDITDIEYFRASPYEVDMLNPPFYFIIKDARNTLRTTNSFLRSYSNVLHYIASSDLNIPQAVSVFHSSAIGVTEELNIDSDITEYSILSVSLIARNISERLSYRQRVNALQQVSEASSELVIEILKNTLDMLDTLELISYDYYSRIFFDLENELYNREDFFERRKLSREILQLNNTYENLLITLSSLQRNLNLLIETEKDIYNIIKNEKFDNETAIDFILTNYEFYEEL